MPLTTRDRQLGYRFVYFLFDGRSKLAIELDHLCGVENVYSARGELSYQQPGSVYGKVNARQLRSTPVAASGSGHTGT